MATLFTKIINRDIPASILYEDELCIAILDIAPVNKGHALVISRKEYPTTATCPDHELQHLMSVAKRLDVKMREALQADATNIIINNGPAAGQEVPHLHIHIIPRFHGDNKKVIPTKEVYTEGELGKYAEKLSLSQ